MMSSPEGCRLPSSSPPSTLRTAAHLRDPQSLVIRSLFDADGERGVAGREDLGMWSDSKGKRLEGRAVAVEARKVADRVIAVVQPVEAVRPKLQRPKVKTLFGE